MLDTSLKRAFFHAPFTLGNVSFTAYLFGKPENWSLSQLGEGVDPVVREEFAQRIGKTLYNLRISRPLAPSPVQFTDRIIPSTILTTPISVGPMTLWRNAALPADGVDLEAGQAYVVSSANCPSTTMVRKGKVLALHTGRECLIDKDWLKTGKHASGRRYHSICYSAIEQLGVPSEVHVKVFWAEPHQRSRYNFRDARYGKTNERMYGLIGETWGSKPIRREGDTFFLNLPELIKAQCMRLGVPESQINLSHAHQMAEGTWLDGTPGTSRNLFVLARRS